MSVRQLTTQERRAIDAGTAASSILLMLDSVTTLVLTWLPSGELHVAFWQRGALKSSSTVSAANAAAFLHTLIEKKPEQ